MIGTMDTRSYASTATGRNDFVTPELTPEQHKLLLELRRRRQEILLEIQIFVKVLFPLLTTLAHLISTNQSFSLMGIVPFSSGEQHAGSTPIKDYLDAYN
uniref:Uncharacterized protein n=1 Tax=Glossina morsitans morsitans TaxID=37546 RepID=A0A1B0FI49_GLOMM